MIVKNLMSWAGEGFSHVPGDLIELADDVAAARAAAGLVELIPESEATPAPETTTKRKATKTK